MTFILEEHQREMHVSMGFETPEPVVYPPLPPLDVEDHGRGTATLEVKTVKKKLMTTMRLKKKTPSEDIDFPSLFLVFDAKGGEEDPYLFIYSSGCNIRLSTTCVYHFVLVYVCLYEL
jgi:hypothetical protein